MTMPFTLAPPVPVGGATGGTPGTTGAGTPGCAVTGEAVATAEGSPWRCPSPFQVLRALQNQRRPLLGKITAIISNCKDLE